MIQQNEPDYHKKTITILYSGGLDSLIMYHYAKVMRPNATVRCIWFDIGQPYNEKEMNALPDFVERRVLDWLRDGQGIEGKGNETGQIYIPGRNAVLITAAACMTLADEVWLGALLGETHDKATDKNDLFRYKIQELLTYTLSPFRDLKTGPVLIKFPLAEAGFNKLTSVQWAIENGLTPDQLKATSSCLSGEPGNCGKCVVCFRRWGIFKQCGFEEHYNVDPLTVPENLAMVSEMLKGPASYYDEHRRSEILPALPRELLDRINEDMYLRTESN